MGTVINSGEKEETLEETNTTLTAKVVIWCNMRKVTSDSVLCYVLVCLFGVGSWIAVNGLWSELPLLVEVLPEKWHLPSYLTVIIQCANIGPLFYTVANHCSKGRLKEPPFVYLLVLIGCVSCVLSAILWRNTVYILGANRSVPLICLTFFLSLVDCTSSVVFLPYMASFPVKYMTGFYIGEGLSGLLPSLVALIQGLGGETVCVNTTITNHTHLPNGTWYNYTEYILQPKVSQPLFPVSDFFIFLSFMMLICGTSFTLLNVLPQCRRLKVLPNEPSLPDIPNGDGYDSDSSRPLLAHKKPNVVFGPRLSKHVIVLVLGLTCWINALSNGFLPAIQSYYTLPYAGAAYHLAINLSSIANPLVCFLALFFPTYKWRNLVVMVVLITTGASYFTVTAALSPYPPLAGTTTGQVIIVLCSITMTALVSYSKVTIASMLRGEGRQALIWCGAMTQIGSTLGAISGFTLVNIFSLFHSAPSSC
ncbi:unnamed protein product [Owenia fusiformis]|uniref:Riboflavin transporter n=1 Tax=Owenia fusiformis TaxID=6347 RepID=A0A8J1TWW5_OWEFU|nr:unnamed protein product [Owenia fusiformis]